MGRTWSSDPDCLHDLATGLTPGHGVGRTVALWTRRTGNGVSGLGRQVQVLDGAGIVELIVFNADGNKVKAQTGYATNTETRNDYPSLNDWHHYAYRYTYTAPVSLASTADIFEDGSAVGSQIAAAGSGAADASGDIGEIHIGNDPTHGRSYQGDLAHFAIWSRELTAAEIASLAGGTNPLDIHPDDLLIYLPIYGDVSPEPDASGNGHSFTINGTIPQSGTDPTVNPPTASDPFDDDFTGTDGNPWNQEKWEQDAGTDGGSTVIDTNQGKASGSNGNADSGGRGRGKQGQVPNQEMTGTFQLCETGEPCNGALWLQTSDDWAGLDFPTEGYGVRLPSDSDTATLLVASGGVLSQLDSAVWPRDTGLKQFKFRRQSTKVRFRIWDDGDPEPEGWLLSADDSVITPDAVGAFQVSYTCPTAPSVDACATYDTLTVDENDTPIPDENGGNGSDRIGGTGAIRRSAAAVRRGRRG